MTEMVLTESAIGDIAILTVENDLDVYGAPKLREALQRIEERGQYRILLDLAACTFLDAKGLAAISVGLTRARDRGGDLAVAAAPEPVLRMFRLTGLVKVLALYESRDKGVAAMSGEAP